MKVTLPYTVDIDDVPAEIKKMIRKLEPTIKNVSDNLSSDKLYELTNSKNVNGALELLAETRKEMIDVDRRLNDINNILIVYQKGLLFLHEQKQIIGVGGEGNKVDE